MPSLPERATVTPLTLTPLLASALVKVASIPAEPASLMVPPETWIGVSTEWMPSIEELKTLTCERIMPKPPASEVAPLSMRMP